MALGPEPPTPRGPEKPVVARLAPEVKPIEAPRGPTEAAMVRRIQQDGEPDIVLRDIASEGTPDAVQPTIAEQSTARVGLSETGQSFEVARTNLGQAREFANAAAHLDQIDPNSALYKTIQARLAKGETLEEIQLKSASSVEALRITALDVELPYRQAQVGEFRSLGEIPASNEEYVEGVNRFQSGEAINLRDPISLYIAEKLRFGVQLESIRKAARVRLDTEQALRRKLEIAQRMKAGSRVPLGSADYQELQSFQNQGWSIDNIVSNLEGSLARTTQGKEYKLALMRLQTIPIEREGAFIKREELRKQLYERSTIAASETQISPIDISPALAEPRTDYETSFKEFARKNAARMKVTNGGEFNALVHFIYTEYYGRALEVGRFPDGAPQTQGTIEAIKRQQPAIESFFTSHPQLERTQQDTWLFAHNKARGAASWIQNSEDIGRFYINVKPEAIPTVFMDIAQAIDQGNRKIDIKMPDPSKVSARDLNRVDKIVLYFGKDEQEAATQMMQQLAKAHPNDLEPTRPRMTAGVKDESGKEIPGIGFGQEPTTAWSDQNFSFGMLRANMLARIVNEAAIQNLTIDDPRFDFKGTLGRAATTLGINPEHPAFNSGLQGEEIFALSLPKFSSDTGKLAP